MNVEIGRDKNGNSIVRVKIEGCRGFSVQTNGNMPKTHSTIVRGEFNPYIAENEVMAYVKTYGTEYQRDLLGR